MLAKLDGRTNFVLMLAIVCAFGAFAIDRLAPPREGPRRSLLPEARADAGYDATYLVNTAGVVSSTGATAVRLLQIPGGSIAPSSHRFWVGGITIFNTDASTHPAALVSHHTGRVMWACQLPAASGVILDNTNFLSSDVGTTALPEGVDLLTESAGAGFLGAVGQGYVR